MDEVPVQFYQSIIAVELAVTGALLFQIRYFSRSSTTDHDETLPDPRLRLLMAGILAATIFGSLDAILHREGTTTAIAVTLGLALSLLPILIRVLPPLIEEARDDAGRTYSTVTAVGLVSYGIAVVAVVLALSR